MSLRLSSRDRRELERIADWLENSGIRLEGRTPAEVFRGFLLWFSFWEEQGLHPKEVIELQPVMAKFIKLKQKDRDLAKSLLKRFDKMLDKALMEIYEQDRYVRSRLARLKDALLEAGREADMMLLSLMGLLPEEEEEEEGEE